MVALLGYVLENDDDLKRQMVTYLEKIISLLRQVCPEDENGMTPGSYETPGQHDSHMAAQVVAFPQQIS